MGSDYQKREHTTCKGRGQTVLHVWSDHYKSGSYFRPKFCPTCFRSFKRSDTKRI